MIAYEFRGTWLKCWLECEVDGNLVASTPDQAVSPKWFDSEAKVQTDEAEKVSGWITVWGDDRDELNLRFSAELSRDDGTMNYSLPFQCRFKIPELPDEVLKEGTNSVGTTLEIGWTNTERFLPTIGNQPVALQSYSWTDKTRRDWSNAPDPHQSDPNQIDLRQVKVTLYCAVPDENITPTAIK